MKTYLVNENCGVEIFSKVSQVKAAYKGVYKASDTLRAGEVVECFSTNNPDLSVIIRNRSSKPSKIVVDKMIRISRFSFMIKTYRNEWVKFVQKYGNSDLVRITVKEGYKLEAKDMIVHYDYQKKEYSLYSVLEDFDVQEISWNQLNLLIQQGVATDIPRKRY